MAADVRSPTLISDSGEVITRIENELRTLHRQLRDVQNGIAATKAFVAEQTSYATEVYEQRARLVSLNLYVGDPETDHTCPLCETQLDPPAPAAEDLNQSLRILEQQLDAVVAERPHLQERLELFGRRRGEIERAIVSTQRELERAYADDEKARVLRDQVIERARVVGRVGALLDEIDSSDASDDIDALIEEAQRRVDVLAAEVNADDIEERVFTFLNLIADRMTEYASDLGLEHAERRMRLDLRNLSVVAETVTGPIPLSRIGSGENWVGYHVVTFLALHWWSREQRRPVPGISGVRSAITGSLSSGRQTRDRVLREFRMQIVAQFGKCSTSCASQAKPSAKAFNLSSWIMHILTKIGSMKQWLRSGEEIGR